MEKIYYFDYVATTKPSEEILKIFNDIETKYYLNSQSDVQASNLLRQGKEKVLELLGLKEGYEVVFTSGGTEANNIAILGKYKNEKSKKHFITSSIEHPSVIETFYELERLGHEVTFVKPLENGIIEVNSVLKEIKSNTAMVSIMSINNELGTVQPVNYIFEEVKKINSSILTMCDFVQAQGKIKIDFTNVDLGTFSAHKINGLKGIGMLVKKKNISMDQLIQGSKVDVRPGTQSLGAQISFVNALKGSIEQQKENLVLLNEYKNYFIKNFVNDTDICHKVKINGENSVGIINITLDVFMQAQTITEMLYSDGIIISTKSSCAQKLNKPSHVLTSINLTEKELNRTIRISFSKETTYNEIDYLIKKLKMIVISN